MNEVYKYRNAGYTLVVNKFSARYARCGTHNIELNLAFDLDDLNAFLKQLGVKPLKEVAIIPPEDKEIMWKKLAKEGKH